MFTMAEPVVQAYAVKSADAVAALEASGLNRACQTAPLCPIKVPILNYRQIYIDVDGVHKGTYQSPVTPSRSMGLPS